MKVKIEMRIKKGLHLIVDSIAYFLLFYILVCCEFAFREKSFIFFALKFTIFYRYYSLIFNLLIKERWSKTHKLLFASLLCIAIFLLSYAITAILVYTFGYLDIAPVLKEAF